VRRFSGYALSHDDWMQHKDKLVESVKDRDDVDMEYGFYTVGYNSPFKMFNRRNEIWMMKKAATKENQYEKTNSVNGGNDKYEKVPYEVLEKSEKYELRQYPTSNWVCHTQTVDPTKDPMNGWEQKYNNNPFVAMSDGDWKDTPTSKMFMKLFKYISGVNTEYKEIAMTIPVTTAHVAKDNGMETVTMCFWLGTPWQKVKPPAPIEKDVYIQNRQAMKVYVKVFGGFALSNDDYNRQYQAFKTEMAGKQTKDGIYYGLSYNSPWETERRNEIWLQAI